MSDTAISYAFEQLEPSDPPPRDAPARMIAQASAEAEQIREQARSEGFSEGYRAGHEDGAAEISAAVSALGDAVQGIESLRGELVDAIERDAIALSLELAAKILGGTLQARPELVLEVVRGALRRVSDRRRITVTVNPGDLELVRSSIGDLVMQGSTVEACEVLSDERVGRGGAIVRTIEGEVDASVQTQLERAREAVEATLESGERAA